MSLEKTKPISAERSHSGGTGGTPVDTHGRDAHATELREAKPSLGGMERLGNPTVGVCYHCGVPAAGFPRQTNPISVTVPEGAKALPERSYGESYLRSASEKQSQLAESSELGDGGLPVRRTIAKAYRP